MSFWKRKKESLAPIVVPGFSPLGTDAESVVTSQPAIPVRKTEQSGLKYEINYFKGAKFNIRGRGMVQLYRIVARQSILEWGVSPGDVGGWVEDHDCLSQFDNSWIANEAKVLMGVQIKGNALIKDNAVVMRKSGDGKSTCFVKGNAQVSENALVVSCSEVSGNSRISGDALVQNSLVRANATITDKAQVFDSEIAGDAVIKETASVHGSTVLGMSVVEGYSLVRENSTLKGANYISGKAVIGPGQVVISQVIDGKKTSSLKTPVGNRKDEVVSDEVEKWNAAIDSVINNIIKKNDLEHEPNIMKLLGEDNSKDAAATNQVQQNDVLTAAVKSIEEEYNSYSHDIVKLIKYPLMTDSTFEPVGKFQQKLRKVKRHMDSASSSLLTEEMVDDLETAYLAMESACVKESTRNLDDDEKKKLKTAGQLVDMALNEASSEHEKASSAKKALDYLEGIVLVPEAAVETFRVRAGLKELTAG